MLIRFLSPFPIGLIKATYGSTLELAPPQVWGINYLLYIRNFHWLAEDIYSLLCPESAFDPNPSLRQYMIENQLPQQYLAQTIDDRQQTNPDPDDPLKYFDSLDSLNEDINRGLTWSLCNTILEQLQGIVIPLTDIDRYLDLVPRLCSLQSVTFFLDGTAGWFEGEYDDLSNEQKEMVRQRKTKRVHELETAVEFVKTHTATFRGSLRMASIPQHHLSFEENEDVEWFRNNPWVCPNTYRNEMMSYLPGLFCPISLTNKNWLQFTAKSEQTDVSHVSTIDMDGFTGPWYHLLKSKSPFLHQCQYLKFYRMVSLGPDSFKSTSDKERQRNNDTWPPIRLQLPSLEYLSILAYNEPFGSELDDIGRSCGATIQYIHIRGHQGPQENTTIPPVRIGDRWNMPALFRLHVQMGSERLIVDPDFLPHCPSLEVLSLSDNHRTYNLSEIEVGQPAFLPKVTRLLLCGTPALSFHPDTLHSTKDLEILALGIPEGPLDQNVPSAHPWDTNVSKPLHSDYEDLTGAMFSFPRPQWTWDWDLPNLVSLELSVGFALHFQFRMLQKCSNLRELFLSIFSEEGRVERILTKKDFAVDPMAWKTEHRAAWMDQATQGPEDVSLHSLTLHDLYEIQNRFIREGPQAESQDVPLAYEQPPPSSRSAERNFEEYRAYSLMSSRKYRRCVVFNPDRDFRKTPVDPREGCDDQIRAIEEQVAQEPLLQPILHRFMDEQRAVQEKKVGENENQRQFRMAHPECLVVPSLKKLLIFGHWIISEEVLEIMLGRVFRNLEQVSQYQCEGFEDEAWVRIIKEMPYQNTSQLPWL